MWAVRRLRTHIHSSNRNTVVLTDYEAIKGILAQTSLKTVSINRTNRRFVNASVYLLAYPFDVYHMPGKFNLVFNALFRLAAVKNNEIKARNEKPALNANAVFVKGSLGSGKHSLGSGKGFLVLAVAETVITDKMRDRFRAGYKANPV